MKINSNIIAFIIYGLVCCITMLFVSSNFIYAIIVLAIFSINLFFSYKGFNLFEERYEKILSSSKFRYEFFKNVKNNVTLEDSYFLAKEKSKIKLDNLTFNEFKENDANFIKLSNSSNNQYLKDLISTNNNLNLDCIMQNEYDYLHNIEKNNPTKKIKKITYESIFLVSILLIIRILFNDTFINYDSLFLKILTIICFSIPMILISLYINLRGKEDEENKI